MIENFLSPFSSETFKTKQNVQDVAINNFVIINHYSNGLQDTVRGIFSTPNYHNLGKEKE